MADKPFWESEKDLTDAQQERIQVNEDFQSQQPDESPRVHKDEIAGMRWGFDPAPGDEFP